MTSLVRAHQRDEGTCRWRHKAPTAGDNPVTAVRKVLVQRSADELFIAAQAYMKGSETLEQKIKNDPEMTDTKRLENAGKVTEGYGNAANALSKLIEERRETASKELRAQAMYWAGECYYRVGDYKNAYLNLKRCTFEYPESEWARRCRGFLLEQGKAFSEIDK